MNAPALVFVDVYRSRTWRSDERRGRPQTWRWRAINGNNQRRLAASSEAYTNKQDCLDAIAQLFGSETNVYLREAEHGNVALRLAVEQ